MAARKQGRNETTARCQGRNGRKMCSRKPVSPTAKFCRQCFLLKAAVFGRRTKGNANAAGAKGNKGNASGNDGNKGNANAAGAKGNKGNDSAAGVKDNKGNASGNVDTPRGLRKLESTCVEEKNLCLRQ